MTSLLLVLPIDFKSQIIILKQSLNPSSIILRDGSNHRSEEFSSFFLSLPVSISRLFRYLIVGDQASKGST
jgi:hypothetical protein